VSPPPAEMRKAFGRDAFGPEALEHSPAGHGAIGHGAIGHRAIGHGATGHSPTGHSPSGPAATRPSPITQLLRFGAIGAVSTLVFVALFALFRQGMGAQQANLLALLITAVANTAANRRLTFGVRGSDGAWRHQGQGLVVFSIGLGLTSGSLWLLDQASGSPPRRVELAVLVLANLAATLVRFTLLRTWVFGTSRVAAPD